jgi:hypothetical protein
MGKFKPEDVEKLLVACHRCCCVCHRYCGVKMEIDHIIPQAEGGPDTCENAISVCLECHAEIHSYNPKHPRGRKFQPDELRGHRDQWISICKEHPEIFRSGSFTRAEVGPLQSLIDELEFNEAVTDVPPGQDQFCLFKERQFLEAMRTGSIATLHDELKRSINAAYVQMGQANQLMSAQVNTDNPSALGDLHQRAMAKIKGSRQAILGAKQELLKFLGNEN